MLIANTIAAIFLGFLSNFNLFVSDLSIIISIALISLIKDNLENGLKIGLSYAFILFGIIRFILCLFAPNHLLMNWLLLIVLLFVCIEFILLMFAEKLNQK